MKIIIVKELNKLIRRNKWVFTCVTTSEWLLRHLINKYVLNRRSMKFPLPNIT